MAKENRVRRVRMPGFLVKDEEGLGQALMRVTSAIGIKPCGGCHRRAESLDRRLVLYSHTEDRP